MVGPALVATPGSVHTTFIELQLLIILLKLNLKLKPQPGLREVDSAITTLDKKACEGNVW